MYKSTRRTDHVKPSNSCFSEIGKLKKVMLHRPGKEIENLMPDYLERLLFDDIPFLEDAQKEHDAFAQALRDEGVEVLYLEKLAAESLVTPEIREQFIDEYLEEANIRGRATKKAIRKLLLSIKDNQELVENDGRYSKRQNCQKSLLKKKV